MPAKGCVFCDMVTAIATGESKPGMVLACAAILGYEIISDIISGNPRAYAEVCEDHESELGKAIVHRAEYLKVTCTTPGCIHHA